MPYKDKQKRLAAQKQYSRTFYRRHKKEEIARVKARKCLLREEFRTLKCEQKCHDCGFSCNNNPEVCDFHHVDPSTKDRSSRGMQGIFLSYGMERLLKEIKKCIVLCSNCHRIREMEKHKQSRFA